MSEPCSRVALLSAVLMTVLLAGCSTGPDGATSTPGGSPTSTATETAVPSAGSSPPEAEPVDCENVLDPGEYDVLAGSGLALSAEAAPLGPAATDLVEHGALSCVWVAPQSDVALWVARLPEFDAEWETRRAELLDSGWTQTDDPVTGTHLAPPEYIEIAQPAILHANGVTIFVSSPESVRSLAEVD